MISRSYSIAQAIAMALLVATSASGQGVSGSASVSGTVTDATGGVIPGADVILISPDRGSEQQVSSNESGNYTYPDVTPGVYSVRVSADGFATKEVTDLQVQVGQRAVVDLALDIGQVTEVVTVEAAAVLLETESNAIGTVVDSERVNELPLNGRNFLQLALLSGGTAPAEGRASFAGQIGHPGRFVVVGGVKAANNSYTINGIQVRGARGGELAINVSVANVDQFKVQSSFFMPDQGPNPSMVNVTTRGGTNEFHGELFEFVRNTALDARSFFAPGPEELKRNQFGFAVGGPVVPNKVWFRGGYEGMRERVAFSRGVFTPTQAMFGGDFSEDPFVIHDPDTLDREAGRRNPFPNQAVPRSRFNSVSENLLQYYLPGSSFHQRPNNLFVHPRNTVDDNQFNVRIDTQLTPKQSLFSQFIWSDNAAVRPGAFPLSGAFYPNEFAMWMIQHTYTISPKWISTLRLGVSRNQALFSNEAREVGDILTPLGITGTFDTRGVFAQGIQGFTGFGRSNGDLGNIDNNYQLDPGMTYISGNHQFRFGASIRYRRTWQQNANAGAHGGLRYNRVYSAQLATNAAGNLTPDGRSGNAFADYLLGTPDRGSTRGLPMLPYRHTQFMPYVQDTWKVRRNLTLNWGLSWFKDTIPNPQGRAADFPHGFDPATGLLEFAVLGQVDPRVIEPDSDNFAPRLGLAWQLDDKTVIRAGAGAYFSDMQLIELQFSAVGPPFTNSVDAINTGKLIPEFIPGVNIFPVVPLPPIDDNFAQNLPSGITPFTLQEEGRTPYVQQWNLSVQRTLGDNDLLELSYLGNSGHRQQNRYDNNQCQVGPDLRCDRSTRPYLRYNAILQSDFNANSSYNALIARYHHRMSGGLDFRVEYTFGKALYDGWELGGATNNQIATNRALDKGPTSFNVKHRGVVSAIWELPLGRGRRFGSGMGKAADAVVGGWNVTTIATFSNGLPILITVPNRTGSPFVGHRPNRTCSGNLSNVDLRRDRLFIDRSCFQNTERGFFGNSDRAPISGPGLNQFDIGIQKQVALGEARFVQFRVEMFNAFNHAQFLNPNGNVANRNFGLVGGTRRPRLVQLGLKLVF
ncbi:MAG: TonB-dependent receptor [Bryobacterales bacterium]|nr:TonB-dependent receptor [Bryobacterales bacterium]